MFRSERENLIIETDNLLNSVYSNSLIDKMSYQKISNSLRSQNISIQSLYKIKDKLGILLMRNSNADKKSYDQELFKHQKRQIEDQRMMIEKQSNQINKIVNFFNNDFILEDNHNEINNRYHLESTDRSSIVNKPSEYLPRLSQPKIQGKLARNNFEIDYQERFQQRNDFNHESYMSNVNKDERIQKINDQLDKDDIRKNFSLNEREQLRKFQNSQNIRKKLFEKNLRDRRDEFIKNLSTMKENNLDPYNILGCNKNDNIDVIKSKYKKMALMYHPDRPNGNTEKFQLITKAWLSIVEDFKNHASYKDFNTMREDGKNYMKKQNNEKKVNINIDKDNFNIKLFNKIYDDNKLMDNNDEGYGDWFKNDHLQINDQPKIFSDKFNINVFNSVFEDSKKANTQNQVITYKEPIPTNINNELAFNNLGEDRIVDFSGNTDSLNFTDLKMAHTNSNLIDTRSVNIKEYKNVEDLEKARSNISYNMNEEDQYEYNLRKQNDEREEIERQRRLKHYDEKHLQNYNRVHKMLIGN